MPEKRGLKVPGTTGVSADGNACKKIRAKLPSLLHLTVKKSPTNKQYLQSFSRVVGKRGEPLVWYKKNGHPWWTGLLCSPEDPFLNPPLPDELKKHRPGRVLVLGLAINSYCWVLPSRIRDFRLAYDEVAPGVRRLNTAARVAVQTALEECNWKDHKDWQSMETLLAEDAASDAEWMTEHDEPSDADFDRVPRSPQEAPKAPEASEPSKGRRSKSKRSTDKDKKAAKRTKKPKNVATVSKEDALEPRNAGDAVAEGAPAQATAASAAASASRSKKRDTPASSSAAPASASGGRIDGHKQQESPKARKEEHTKKQEQQPEKSRIAKEGGNQTQRHSGPEASEAAEVAGTAAAREAAIEAGLGSPEPAARVLSGGLGRPASGALLLRHDNSERCRFIGRIDACPVPSCCHLEGARRGRRAATVTRGSI
ncbi:hypothetical protein cyc_08275 [Cyclospora cayetanensis]|uniref:PWWP domain-containing protein n=1 Tax=Cyclospora cayetanensis TaxID=88456 RepID=A0A1D3CUK0_9EIME|nr:hypothetical protein cyc_08275 [Cyclospora cayetanensis]